MTRGYRIVATRVLALCAGVCAGSCDSVAHVGNDLPPLPADRVIDWSHAGVPGGIPHRTTICDVALGPSSTFQNVQDALDSCPADSVVFLPAGTYTLALPDEHTVLRIHRDGITLRGAGADQTVLQFTGTLSSGDVGLVLVSADTDPEATAQQASWATGFTRGTTTITLTYDSPPTDPGTLLVGSILHLDQRADGVTVFGTCLGCSRADPDGTARDLAQNVIVRAVQGNTITFEPGLYSAYWSSTLMPEAWWSVSEKVVRGSGVEDLKIDSSGVTSTDVGDSGSSGIGVKLTGTFGCWVKNVDVFDVYRHGVFMTYSQNFEIRDGYFHHPQWTGRNSFGVDLHLGNSDGLVINNIIDGFPAAVWVAGNQGDVIAYNFGETFPAMGVLPATVVTAGGHPHYVLFEGNVMPDVVYQSNPSSASHDTSFRNRLSGWESLATVTANYYPIHIFADNKSMSLVGNVLGTSMHAPESDGPIWDESGAPMDPTTMTTLSHGNVDASSATPRVIAWDPGEPRFLPASLFLAAQPAWWSTPFGTSSWPPIGPDPEDSSVLHDEPIPAQRCYENRHLASDGSFDAALCYETP